jgi:PAS domain S-box-containing protein
MADNTGWRILVVDDEYDIREVLALSLRDAGYTVQTAEDGVRGLAQVEVFAPHIVVTDVRMPGLDGLQMLEHIKRRSPRIEVIVATAFAEIDLAVKALRLDASDFITKPIDHDTLTVAVERAKERIDLRNQAQQYTRFLEEGWNETTDELLSAFKYQRQLIECSMDGILGCDVEEKIVIFNRSLRDLLGYSNGEPLRFLSLSRFFDPPDLMQLRGCLARNAVDGSDQLWLHETKLRGRDGQLIPIQLSVSVITHRDQPEGLVCFIRDLRRVRRLELQMADQARILHQDKMMSLGRLAASVAHEINNPLAGVLNYLRLMTRLLKNGPADGERQSKFQHYLDICEHEVDRCSHIVSSLLSFSRPSERPHAPLSVPDLLGRCVELSRHRLELSHIHLTVAIADQLPQVVGDANQLEQCFINLIFNAMDAMPDGGQLALAASADPDGKTVRINVSDNGCGISPENHERIFEPFFTTKSDGHGTGLGLSTTYAIIQRHGGTIHVQSQLGQGATFTITLPAAEPENPAAANYV